MRLPSVAFLLSALSLSAFAANQPQVSFCELITLGAAYKDPDALELLGAVSDDPLINKVAHTHARTRLQNMPEKKSLNWKKYDFSWMLLDEHSEIIDELIDRPNHGAHEEAPNLLQWLAKLEKVYKDAGLDPARTWTHGRGRATPNRILFVRAVVLRSALETQERLGFDKGPLLWSTKPEVVNFVNSMSDEITYAFGNLRDMQWEYDKYYVQHKGRYLTAPAGGVSKPRWQAVANLKEVAALVGKKVNLRKIWQPWVENFRSRREQMQGIEDWFDGIRYWQEEELPLTPLLVLYEQGHLDSSRVNEVLNRWSDMPTFVRELNAYLETRGLPLVEIGLGIDSPDDNFGEVHWRRELLVQACLLQIRLHQKTHPFGGFSLTDTGEDFLNNPYQILSTGSLWRDARFSSVSEMQQIVLQRLFE